MSLPCVCGHVDDEHEEGPRGNLTDCLVPDCPCILFDWDPDDEGIEDDE